MTDNDYESFFDPEKSVKSTEYMEMTRETAIYPEEDAKAYLGMGLNGEAGEVAELLKKEIRDDELNRLELALELGDVLWYVFRIADEYDFKIRDILKLNFIKLKGEKSHDELIEEFNAYEKAVKHMAGVVMLFEGLNALMEMVGVFDDGSDRPALPEEVDNSDE